MGKNWTAVNGHPGIFREGDRYVIRARRRDANGKQHEKTRRLPRELTLEEAALERAHMVQGLAHSLFGNPSAEPLPAPAHPRLFSGYVDAWLAQRSLRLKASTQALYADVLGGFILPFLGDIPTAELRRAHIEAWVIWAEKQRSRFERQYAQATIDQWWRVLGVVARDAAADLGQPDPMRRVRKPRSSIRRARAGVFLTAEELGRLMKAVRHSFPRWYPEVFIASFTGLRPGELYALRWEDVDDKAGLIHIRRSHWKGHEGTVKTEDPRSVALTDEMREVLREHRARMLRNQHRGLRSGLVFPAEHGGFRGPEAIRNMLRTASKLAKLPRLVSGYDLRRSFNNLARQWSDRIVLRAMMGHCSEEMTERYSGAHPAEKAAAVGRLMVATGMRDGPDDDA